MLSRTRITSRVWRSVLVHIGGALVLVAMACVATAQSPAPPADLESRIDRLIRDLADDRPEVRQKAASELMKIGLPAVKKLTAAAKDAASEPGQLAADLLKDIARVAAGLRFSSQIKRPELMGAVTLVLSPDGKFVYVPG
ncbi:MAG TPA: hypothetical protein VGY58_18480, partial [Gemmataceae bacterium]|nr:hypothetical protein [Gemmataceae bacterium]